MVPPPQILITLRAATHELGSILMALLRNRTASVARRNRALLRTHAIRAAVMRETSLSGT
jgi:hypothetical protein